MTGELHWEHWKVPVHGLTPTDADGLMHVSAHPEGTVSLHLTCGGCRTTVRLDVGQAAQLCTGIWEAAGAAQHLSTDPDQPPPPHDSDDLPEAWRTHLRRNTQRPRRRPTSINEDAARAATRTIGLRLRRLRHARGKSLQVISGLAGMNAATLHHLEYGRRELTLSEIAALAGALQTDPWTLITLPNCTRLTSRGTDQADPGSPISSTDSGAGSAM